VFDLDAAFQDPAVIAAMKAEGLTPADAPAPAPSPVPAEPGAAGGAPAPTDAPADAGQPAPVVDDKDKPTEGGEPTDAGNDGKDKDAPEADKDEGKTDPELTRRLARIAREQHKLDEKIATFREEQRVAAEAAGAMAEKAKRWEAFDAAKTKGDKIEALKTLYSKDEIEGDLYLAMTEYVASGGKEGLTREEAVAIARKELEDARAAEAAAKAAEAAAAAEKSAAIRSNYVRTVESAYDADKYPAIETHGVSGEQLLQHADAFFQEHKRGATPEELLQRIEDDFVAKAQRVVEKKKPPTPAPAANGKSPAAAPASAAAAPAPAPKPPATATVSARQTSDAPPVNTARRLTAEEALEEALRQAGL
jgi:hypothetical protein